jgi:NAD(P)H-hydrate epimerase
LKQEGGFSFLTSEEMSQLDRAAVDEYGVDVLMLMENAGGAAALLANRMLGGVEGRHIVCLVGKGNNGGDGLVAVRRLSNWGANPRVLMGCSRGDMRDIPAKQLRIVERMGVPVAGPEQEVGEADLVIDSLLGYNSKGDPKGPVAEVIRNANNSRKPILAVDVPSGLDATDGTPGDPCIVAQATVTFGFPKAGFLAPGARGFVGELYVGDISLPGGLCSRYHQKPGLFAKDALLRVY